MQVQPPASSMRAVGALDEMIRLVKYWRLEVKPMPRSPDLKKPTALGVYVISFHKLQLGMVSIKRGKNKKIDGLELFKMGYICV
jgi:hypothetical protein